jgi:pimeloyl-ACP methyl ester carboxylesterase
LGPSTAIDAIRLARSSLQNAVGERSFKGDVMFLDLGDAQLFVSSFGGGPKALVAHGGWVGSGELWSQPFELLSRSWRTIAYDHRGTGATINRAPAITFELLVQDLFRVLDALSIDQCVLAGESSGACVVLEAALRDPSRFKGLVIVDGRYSGGRTAGAARLMEGCRTDFPATMDLFVNACVPEEDCDAERRWGKQIVNRSTGPSAIQLMECVEAVNVERRLQEISLPTLIIHGSRDVIAPLAAAEHLAAKIPNSRLVVIEGAGHVPTITRPADVARAIEDFFA